MSKTTQNNLKHLGPDPRGYRRQLFVKGTHFSARDLFALAVDKEEPKTPEEVAAAFGVSVEAAKEAIAYCQSDPAELHQDFEDQEAWFKAHGFGSVR